MLADGGYAGNKLRQALHAFWRWTVQIIRRSDTASDFEVLSRRWAVERPYAWLGRCPRLAENFETNGTSSTAWTLVARVRRLPRKRRSSDCLPAMHAVPSQACAVN
ncbi:transposase [Acidisoma cellulosilytica]|uniref:Transposase n=1 Tax=Acidisoma cellulosilyticum TaxID=2802395 RepID=A0A963Z6Q4_9PROT|nr:transposase [Acidisoma cellulosilyticum]